MVTMARTSEVIEHWTDDVDGSPAAEAIAFAVEGRQYEIDLSADNAAQLRDHFAHWVEHARQVGGAARPASAGRRRSAGRGGSASGSGRGRSRRSAATSSVPSPRDVRAWAVSQGIEVPARGRLSAALVQQYSAAHEA